VSTASSLADTGAGSGVAGAGFSAGMLASVMGAH
jgi:hypothetical protein